MLPKSCDLVSPLDRDECVRRLRARTRSLGEDWEFSTDFGTKPVAGRVEEASFQIYKRVAYGNPFQPRLSGELIDEGGRTRVRCRFARHPLVVLIMGIWFGCLLISGSSVAITAQRLHDPAETWAAMIITVFILALGVVFATLGLLVARNEPRFLVDFLRDTIAAREV
jgi:hypothetical protein